jgi:hypothetical protein
MLFSDLTFLMPFVHFLSTNNLPNVCEALRFHSDAEEKYQSAEMWHCLYWYIGINISEKLAAPILRAGKKRCFLQLPGSPRRDDFSEYRGNDGSKFFRNVIAYIPIYTASYRRRLDTSSSVNIAPLSLSMHFLLNLLLLLNIILLWRTKYCMPKCVCIYYVLNKS